MTIFIMNTINVSGPQREINVILSYFCRMRYFCGNMQMQKHKRGIRGYLQIDTAQRNNLVSRRSPNWAL